MIRKLPGVFILFAVLVLACGGATAAELINGAGASFPYPLYSKWAYAYAGQSGTRVNYQSIGSGGGIKQIKARTVDFGASDAPLGAGDLDGSGLVQFPMAVGGVVPVVNIPGVAAGECRLTGPVLADIFLGRIKRWDDERITALNPGLNLPARKITVVHRSDGSGTTWIFTNYLKKVSPAWTKEVGFGKAVSWPAGIGGKGNEGVANFVRRVKYSIGYVEYAYAVQNRLHFVSLKNRTGEFVAPSMETFTAAASGADWRGTPGFAVVLTDQPGAKAWPIAGATFILVAKEPEDCGTAKGVLKFFDWAYRKGGEMAASLDYVPLSEAVYGVVEDAWAREIRCGGRPLWKD
ncbi:MAG: phosphate ABC transporter substrate-binding protein PstS [Thermodesulfobacteriota bacterium]